MAGREYSDFEPTMTWAREERFDTLLVNLPDFKKDQLKVQITSAGNLRVMGERHLGGNKWTRFRKEVPISSNYDSNTISAKFDKGILHVKLSKIIVPADPRGEAKSAVQPSKLPEPTPTAEPQKTGQKQDIKEPPKAEQVPAKSTEEEKKPKKSTQDEEKPKEVKEERKRADEAKKGPEAALQQKKSGDSTEKKATETDRKHGDTAEKGKKAEKRGKKKVGDTSKPMAKDNQGNFGNLVTKMKKPRNLMNTIVAALLIVVLGLYLKHAFRSLGTTPSEPEL